MFFALLGLVSLLFLSLVGFVNMEGIIALLQKKPFIEGSALKTTRLEYLS
jgi:hypothetical protein